MVPALLVAALWSAAARADEEVVFLVVAQWDAGGQLLPPVVKGGLSVVLSDGRVWTIDPRTLDEAPDGSTFGIEHDSGQDEQGRPFWSVRILRSVPTSPPAPRQEPAPRVTEIDPGLLDWLATASDHDHRRVVVTFHAAYDGYPTHATPWVERQRIHAEARAWVERFQAPWRAEALAAGATNLSVPDLTNRMSLDAPALLLRRWCGDPSFSWIERPQTATE